jgi:hypothetical protein
MRAHHLGAQREQRFEVGFAGRTKTPVGHVLS